MKQQAATLKLGTEHLAKITDEGGNSKQIFNVDKKDLCRKKIPPRTFRAGEKLMPNFKEQPDSFVRS